MMTVKHYDLMEEFGVYISEIEGGNEELKELFFTLVEEEVLTPLYDEKLRLKEEESYHFLVEEEENGNIRFWTSARKTWVEDDNPTEVLEMTELFMVLEEVRKKYY